MQDLSVTADGETERVESERGGGHDCLLFRGWQGRETKHHEPWTHVRWWCSSCLLAPPERAADAGGRNHGRATSRRWVMSFHARELGDEGRHGWGAWMSASGGLPQAAPARGGERIRANVDGREGRAGPISGFEETAWGRCDLERAGRGPHQRQEGRSASPTSAPAIRREGRAGVLDEGQSSTGYRHVNVP